MALSVKASGTQAATLDTLHTLLDTSDSGVYALTVDLNALAAGDVLVLRVYRKVLSGGTARIHMDASYGPIVPDKKIVVSVPVVAPHGAKFELEQTDGTGRSWPWSVEAL